MGPASFLAAVLATTLLLLLTILRHHRRRNHTTRKKYNLPPGPRPWPVIGNLNLIGPLPHRSARELSKRYGPLMSLRFSSFPVVVGSSVDAARFFLRTRDVAFIDRPRTRSGRHIGYNYSDMLWAPYGAYWRQARRLWKAEILSARRLQSHDHIVGEELRAMLRDLYGPLSAGRAAPVVLMDHVFTMNLNVILRMVLGKKYIASAAGSPLPSPSTTPREDFRWIVDEFFSLSSAHNIGDMIPWLNWLDPNGHIRRLKRLRKVFDRFMERVLYEHDERRQREGQEFIATDMVDQLLEIADDPNLEVPIERDGVKAFTLNLIVGLPDTTSVTVEWAMSELLKNPDVLAKAFAELDRVVGHDHLMVDEDIPNLPYIGAIVKETMRLHPVAPMLTPRLSREDTSVDGYDIPAGTLVFVNVWAIGRDPSVWGNATDEFQPERFVGSGVDVKGHHFQLLPFGSGRRMCPGVGLGLKMVQLILANLLHGFAWRLPDGMGKEELSMKEKFGLSVGRTVPLEAVAEPRLPAHIYCAGP